MEGTWAAKFSWLSAVGHVGTSGGKIYMGPVILCAAVLMIGGVELNSGHVESIAQVLRFCCDRILKSGTQSYV